MKRIFALVALAGALALPAAAQAETSGGSRQAAGGAHMSSYVHHHDHDPNSLHSQRMSSGQILGAPMRSESAGAYGLRRGSIQPHWATGTMGRRAR